MKKHSVLSWVFISYCVKSLNLNLKLGRYYSYIRTENKNKIACFNLFVSDE